MLLANFCVAYILTNENELGEDLIRNLEKEEGSTRTTHLCIVNLSVGVLYCSRGNFEFGVSRIVASFDPIPSKVISDPNYSN